jgi:hypothetical protein
MFNFDFTKAPEGTLPKKEFSPIPTGNYAGTVDTAEVKTTAAGNRYINIKIKLENNRVVFDRLNFEGTNQTAKDIAVKKFQSIVFFGIENPVAKFKALEEMASYIKGTPVKIYYADKGKDERGYDKFSITYKDGVIKRTAVSTPAASKTVY